MLSSNGFFAGQSKYLLRCRRPNWSRVSTLCPCTNASISGTTLPALQLKSSTKAFINLASRSENTLSDSEDNEKKEVLHSSGDGIFIGKGSLSVVANKQHALKIDGTLRITVGGILLCTSEASPGNAISADGAFSMDAGNPTSRGPDDQLNSLCSPIYQMSSNSMDRQLGGWNVPRYHYRESHFQGYFVGYGFATATFSDYS